MLCARWDSASCAARASRHCNHISALEPLCSVPHLSQTIAHLLYRLRERRVARAFEVRRVYAHVQIHHCVGERAGLRAIAFGLMRGVRENAIHDRMRKKLLRLAVVRREIDALERRGPRAKLL